MAGKQADIKVGVVTNYDDKGISQAKTGLAGFKQSIADADGVGGKFKAGWGSVTDSVKANAGGMALAAGASLVAFGVKAVGEFTKTAKAALDLGTATGLSTEDASRWIAVADDMGVSAEALTTGLGKIGKTLDGSQWEKYGIATRDAGGEARSTNDILLDSLDALGKIENETERAKAGNALFGKGYASLSPLIGKTRNEMEKYLGEVERGQVITEGEAKKAEKFRLAQDALGDALKDVTIAVGQQVAALAPYLTILGKIITGIQGTQLHQEATDIYAALAPLNDEIKEGGKDLEYWLAQVGEGRMTVEEATKAIHDATLGVEELAISQRDQAAATAETGRETRKLPPAWEAVQDATEAAKLEEAEYKKNSDNTKRAVKQNIDEMIGKWDELRGDIDADQSWLTLQGQFDDVKTKAVEAWDAAAAGAEDSEQKTRDYAMALNDLTLDTINYAEKVKGIPPEKLVNVKAALDQGDIDRAEAMLAILTRNRAINIDLVGRGAAGYNTGAPGAAFATGGVVPGPKGAPVAATVHGGETVRTPEQEKALNGNAGGGNTYNINLAMPVVTSQADLYRAGQTITAAIAEYERRRGF